MAAVSSTSSTIQAAWKQLKLQQAEQAAARAEQVAQSLRTQARDAQTDADRAQDRARNLTVQSDQADVNAGRARQGIAALQTSGQMQRQLSNTATQALQTQERQSQPQPQQQPQPVPNAQGQVTGTLVNVTA